MRRSELVKLGQSAACPYWVMGAKDLHLASKAILVALLDHLHGEADECWPGMGRLSAMTGLTRRTVVRSAEVLEAKGYAKIHRREGRPNRYTLMRPNQGHGVTGDTVTDEPSTRDIMSTNQGHGVTGPVTLCPPTRDMVSPEPIIEPSKEPVIEPTRAQPKRAKRRALKFDIPAQLDAPRFRQAWAGWIAHRKEIGHALTQRSADMQIKLLARHGEPVAIEAIEASVRNGWRGLFPEKVQGARSAPAISTDEDHAKGF